MSRRVWVSLGAGIVAIVIILTSSGSLGTLDATLFTSGPALDSRIEGFSPERLFEESADSVVLILATFDAEALGVSQSLGSGFMASTEGHIITNAHVIEQDGNVGRVEVTARRNGQELPPVEAQVVGIDDSTDTAVLRVDPDKLAIDPLPLGDSAKVSVGQPVVAIGNPLGFSFSLTSGVVSGVGRALQAPNGAIIPNGIQTDAAINQGNSGGPLIDADGKVIGVNEQIATRTGSFSGLGFAVPINAVKEVMRQFIENGDVRHAFLGLEGQTITPGIAQLLALSVGEGVLVARVQPGSAADQAGIRGGDRTVDVQGSPYVVGGDIITRLEGATLLDVEELGAAIAARRPNDQIRLTLMRGEDEREITVTLGERP
jgi:S1-C subfamily serine protease